VSNGLGRGVGWSVIALVVCVVSGASVLASLVITVICAVVGAFG
jgi:hypothetical protein